MQTNPATVISSRQRQFATSGGAGSQSVRAQVFVFDVVVVVSGLQNISVHPASLRMPLSGQMQVLHPSSASNDSPGVHASDGGIFGGVSDGIFDGVSDGIFGGVSDGIFGGVSDGVSDGIFDGVSDVSGTQNISVHPASARMPLSGQAQVLHPSSAVNDSPGVHDVSDVAEEDPSSEESSEQLANSVRPTRTARAV